MFREASTIFFIATHRLLIALLYFSYCVLRIIIIVELCIVYCRFVWVYITHGKTFLVIKMFLSVKLTFLIKVYPFFYRKVKQHLMPEAKSTKSGITRKSFTGNCYNQFCLPWCHKQLYQFSKSLHFYILEYLDFIPYQNFIFIHETKLVKFCIQFIINK